MKILIVFDGTAGATQNLRMALQRAFAHENLAQLQIIVCVLKLLQEDVPLDDYMSELELATANNVELVELVLAEEAMANNSTAEHNQVKVLCGTVSETTYAVSQMAQEWQADQIYLSLQGNCPICADTREKASRPRFFGLKRAHPDAVSSPITKVISANSLLHLSNCQLNISCHGEYLFSMHVQPAAASVRKGLI